MRHATMSALQRQPAVRGPGRFKSGRLTGLAFVFSAALTVTGCQLASDLFDLLKPKRTPEKVILPEGFRGWALVEWGVAGAPPTPLEDGFLVLRIPKCGYLASSSIPEAGWAKDEWYLTTASGTLEEIQETIDSPIRTWTSSGKLERPGHPDRSYSSLYYGLRAEMDGALQRDIANIPSGTICS
jgi:hypothetical protein